MVERAMEKRTECERLKDCPQPVTRNHFNNICNKDNYESCFWFGRWKRTNKSPIKWLQQIAIEQARKAGQMPGELEVQR